MAFRNYPPKTHCVSTPKIKLPKALRDDALWMRLTRFTGRLAVLCGILMITGAFMNAFYFCAAILLIVIALPVICFIVLSKMGK